MAPVDSKDYVLSGIYYCVLAQHRCGKHNVACQHSQQTRDVDLMLDQCWHSACDAGPASNQHWFNASCLLIAAIWKYMYLLISQMSILPSFGRAVTGTAETAKWKYLLISQVCLLPSFGSAVTKAERKYILHLQVNTYRLLH